MELKELGVGAQFPPCMHTIVKKGRYSKSLVHSSKEHPMLRIKLYKKTPKMTHKQVCFFRKLKIKEY